MLCHLKNDPLFNYDEKYKCPYTYVGNDDIPIEQSVEDNDSNNESECEEAYTWDAYEGNNEDKNDKEASAHEGKEHNNDRFGGILSKEEIEILTQAISYNCPLCNTTVKTLPEKLEHSNIHIGQNILFLTVYNCPKCHYVCHETDRFKRHYQKHDAECFSSISTPCPECPYKSNPQGIARHLNYHFIDGLYKCAFCTFSANQQTHVKCHLKCHNFSVKFPGEKKRVKTSVKTESKPKERELLKCTQCKFETYFVNKLNKHSMVHKAPTIQCPECPFLCKEKVDLNIHLKWHQTKSVLQCPFCTFSHYGSSMMTKHKRLHQDDRLAKLEAKGKKEGLKCSICQTQFLSRRHFNRHLLKHKSVDEVKNAVYCADCPYKSKIKDFAFINHLKCHMKQDGIKCNFCSFRHNKMRTISIHERLHTNFT